MMSGVSYRAMHIPVFDEKKLAVWKYQMESIFLTIGCLGIARGDTHKKFRAFPGRPLQHSSRGTFMRTDLSETLLEYRMRVGLIEGVGSKDDESIDPAVRRGNGVG
jgi:hypothetical protein